MPLPLTEIRIVTETGVAPPGEVGEIEIRGPTLFAGYLGDDTAESRDLADGWFRTGDAGYLDGDGYLYVVDRRDDLIISGGENVYPAEIERVLREHPSVLDAGVIGVPDESWGSRPVAAVVWRGDPIEPDSNFSTTAGSICRGTRFRIASCFLPSSRDHPPGSCFAAPCAR